VTDSERKAGACQQKQTTTGISIDLFVSNLDVDYNRDANLRTGSLVTPFIDLFDAITRVREEAAKYSSTITGNIFLFTGDHYLLLDKGTDIYSPYLDRYLNQNYDLTIQPLPCTYPTATDISSICTDSTITLLNKRRELFSIAVPQSLLVSKVVIDSIDSVLTRDKACLSTRKWCCTITNNALENKDRFDTSYDCLAAFNELSSQTELCTITSYNTLFPMNPSSDLTQP